MQSSRNVRMLQKKLLPLTRRRLNMA